MMESNGNGQDKPTLEQWAKLYDVAIRLKEMEPWLMLYDTDIITLGLPGRDELVYCSVMGRAGELYGVAIYPNDLAFDSLIRMVMMDEDTPPGMVFSIQQCLTLYLGDREELSGKDRQVIKDLGLKFRGRGEWIYFRSMQPGYYPWFLHAEEVELMTEALQNLYIACGYLLNQEVVVDFEAGETLLRFYSDEEKEWLNGCIDMPEIQIEPAKIVLDDEMVVARMKNKPRLNLMMEADIFFAPSAVQENRNIRPRCPTILLLADRQDGSIITFDTVDANIYEYTSRYLVNMLAGFIIDEGRPSDIYVRDERTAGLFTDLCDKVDIKLHVGEGMPAINDAYRGINIMMNQLP